MALKKITPDDADRMLVAAREYIKESRQKVALSNAILAFLTAREGKRVDTRISSALKVYLMDQGYVDAVVYYRMDTRSNAMLPRRFTLSVSLNWRRPGEITVGVALGENYTSADLEREGEMWFNVATSASNVELALLNLPQVIERYNAAQQALAEALAPIMRSPSDCVMYPFSAFFKW